MGLGTLTGILTQYREALPTVPPANVEQDYSQVAQEAPQAHLAEGLTQAFR